MKILYSLYIHFLHLGISIASPFNPKAKKWINRRHHWKEKLKSQVPKSSDKKIAWFHVSSLGEYEQALPLVQKMNEKNYLIAVSFFSSSGYDHADDALIDLKFLLPLDTRANADALLQILKPDIVFWVKNDFWIHTIGALQIRKIPLVMVSLIFNKDSFFINSGFSLIEKYLASANAIFVQNKQTKNLLVKKQISDITITGDTRIARVKSRKKNANPYSPFERLPGSSKVIFYASVHKSDMPIVTKFINENHDYIHVIIPHEIDDQSVNNLVKNIARSSVYIEQVEQNSFEKIIIVNKIGILFELYRYADIVYIGGGFGRGIHNILEPTVFGKPVIFGPNYKKFDEACNFIDLGLCYAIYNYKDFVHIIDRLTQEKRNEIHNNLIKYYDSVEDASEIIMDYCVDKKLVS